MSIADVMTRDLPTVGPQDSIRAVAQKMIERKVKALPVCEGERLVGIVTDWDITRAVGQEQAPSERPVRDHMSTDLVTAAPGASFGEAAELMAERELHHLLISDGYRFVGMVHLDVDWSDLGGIAEPIATFCAPI
jgi:CBS domain-containing protein